MPTYTNSQMTVLIDEHIHSERDRRRDSMGRYSRDGYSMAQRLREMSHDAPDETTRREMDRLASRMETM